MHVLNRLRHSVSKQAASHVNVALRGAKIWMLRYNYVEGMVEKRG